MVFDGGPVDRRRLFGIVAAIVIIVIVTLNK